jgi:hypothetical protein
MMTSERFVHEKEGQAAKRADEQILAELVKVNERLDRLERSG